MGAEVKPEDRMTREEILYFYSQGSPIYVLAELNACSPITIKRILNGHIPNWKNCPQSSVVVNADEGIFYPSIRDAEKGEGIRKGCLYMHFKRHGARVKYKGTNFHLYERSRDV